MNKLFAVIVLILIGFSLTGKVHAAVADVTDVRVQKEIERALDRTKKIQMLSAYLKKHNSKLEPFSEDLVAEAEKNEIPWHLLAAISGVESTFCKRIPYNSYNCWGWANGAYHFKDYKDAIQIISKALNEKYYQRGLDTPEKISPVYAPPSKTWAGKVKWFISKIEETDIPSS